MLTSLRRIIKAGWLSFWRNKWLSSATVSIMTLTILGISSLLLINVLVDSLIVNLEDKIDISVYFNLGAEEEEITEVREELARLDEVRSVEYVSREMALGRFKEKHQGNEVLIQSLEELDNNPLEASLNIKAQQASQYGVIVDFLNKGQYGKVIDKINYFENESVIARLSGITSNIRQVGLVVFGILAVVAVLVAFNTIRLTIYNSRKEIKIMQLVGASNWFVRGPFVVEGALYGVVSALLSMLILYPLLWYVSPKIDSYLPGTNLFSFLQVNFFALLLFQVGIGIILGTVSSLIAVRRYLEE